MARRGGTAAVGVDVGGQPIGMTETITDVTQLAVSQQEAMYPTIIARAVARRVLKNGVIYGGKEAIAGMFTRPAPRSSPDHRAMFPHPLHHLLTFFRLQ